VEPSQSTIHTKPCTIRQVRWSLTSVACPRCGSAAPRIWDVIRVAIDIDFDQPIVLSVEVSVHRCLPCGHVFRAQPPFLRRHAIYTRRVVQKAVEAVYLGGLAAHLARKHPRQRPDAARQTDPWVVLFTSHPTWLAAVRSYDRRWSTEGSYRDAQGGWDGQHGWDLEVTLARLSDAVVVERVVGLWALGALVQTWVGHRLGQPSAAAPVPLLRREWTTTGRLSVWARGQFALTDPSGRLRPWLRQTLTAGAHRLATAPLPVHHSTARSISLPVTPKVAA